MECIGDCNKCTNGKCVCDIDKHEYDKDYREKNANKLKEHQRAYYIKNREKMLEKQRVYRELKKGRINP